MKSFAKAGLLIPALLIPAGIAEAKPNPGKWKGKETSWLDNKGAWHRYDDFTTPPVSFNVKQGKASTFKVKSYPYNCDGPLAGQPEAAPVEDPTDYAAMAALTIRVRPVVGKLKNRGGKFQGQRSTSVAGRTLLAAVTGRFTSKGRARGNLKVTLSGCVNTYISTWQTKGPKQKRRRTGGGGGGGGGDGGKWKPICHPHIERDADGYAHSVPC